MTSAWIAPRRRQCGNPQMPKENPTQPTLSIPTLEDASRIRCRVSIKIGHSVKRKEMYRQDRWDRQKRHKRPHRQKRSLQFYGNILCGCMPCRMVVHDSAQFTRKSQCQDSMLRISKNCLLWQHVLIRQDINSDFLVLLVKSLIICKIQINFQPQLQISS